MAALSPDAILVVVLQPIVLLHQRRLQVVVAPAGNTAAHAALVGQWLAEFDAGCTAERCLHPVRGRKNRIAPQQHPLRARPDAK